MTARKATSARPVVRAIRNSFTRYGLRARPIASHLAGVQVWSIEMRASATGLRMLLATLSRTERSNTFRRRTAPLRHAAILSLAVQRLLLAHRLCRPARTLPLERAPNGKPRLRASHLPVPFNASHADGVLLVALGGARPLGIDLEPARRALDPLSLGRQILQAHEFEELKSRPDRLRSVFFLRLWTRKEAAAKADGRGLALGFATLDAFSDPHRVAQTGTDGVRQRWAVRDLALGRRRIGAIATRG